MKVFTLILGLVCSLLSSTAVASTQQFHRIYQPQLSSEGRMTITGKWYEIPAAQIESPRTWVAPFLESGSQLMPKCSATTEAGIEVTSVMGVLNPLITIHVSDQHSLEPDFPRTEMLHRMIECIQLNMKEGAFFNVRVSVDDGVPAEGFAQFEGSYTNLKSKSAA